MENEEIYAQEEVVEQEEQTSEETINEEDSNQEETDDSVTLSKSEFTKLKRQAMAYKATSKTEKPIIKPTQEVNYSNERLERIELMQEGYSRDEVDAIMDLGGVGVLDKPIVQSAIKAMRQEKKSKEVSQNLPSKSPIFKKYTDADVKKMSAEELEKLIQS